MRELRFWTGAIAEVRAPRLAVLGTDCALGKRTTARLLVEACRRAGIRAEMIYTGQTGWMQGGRYGFVLDSTPNDFVAGELEGAVVACDREQQPDLIVIEGQSALRNPSGPCGAEMLVSAGARAVMLQHAPGRPCFKGLPGWDIPRLDEEIALIQTVRGPGAGHHPERRPAGRQRPGRRAAPPAGAAGAAGGAAAASKFGRTEGRMDALIPHVRRLLDQTRGKPSRPAAAC